MTIKRYLLLGAGDLAREVGKILEVNAADTGAICELAVFSNSDSIAPQFTRYCLNPRQAVAEFPPSAWEAIGCVGSPAVRESMYTQFRLLGYRFATACHSQATIFAEQVSPGCIVFPGARLAIGVRLAEDVIVNFNATVGHDCVIGAHTCISPGVQLGGRIRTGKRVLFGISATVIQGRRIDDDAVIAAGSAVWTDVAAGSTMIGVPAVVRKVPGSKSLAAVVGSESSALCK